MHGPAVAADRRQRRTCYLIAFLDDATRLCPFAAFARAENTTAFLPTCAPPTAAWRPCTC